MRPAPLWRAGRGWLGADFGYQNRWRAYRQTGHLPANIGIQAGLGADRGGAAAIHAVELSGYGAAGIVVANASSGIIADANTLTGAGTRTGFPQSGFLAQGGGRMLLKRNTIRRHYAARQADGACPGAADAAALPECSSAGDAVRIVGPRSAAESVIAIDNSVHDNQAGTQWFKTAEAARGGIHADSSVSGGFGIATMGGVNVVNVGAGDGSVTSSPAGIDEPSGTRDIFLAVPATVTLTATPAAGSQFAGWSSMNGSPNPCGAAPVCAIALTDNTIYYMAANWIADPATAVPLTINFLGQGGGAVVGREISDSEELPQCHATCTVNFPLHKGIYYNAVPDAMSTSPGFTGDCQAPATCTLSMDAPRTVNVEFDPNNVAHGADVVIFGPGSVTSSPSGINCPAVCGASFPAGVPLTLREAPTFAPASFLGWPMNTAASPPTPVCDPDLYTTALSGAIPDLSTTCHPTIGSSLGRYPTVQVSYGYHLTFTKTGLGAGLISGSADCCNLWQIQGSAYNPFSGRDCAVDAPVSSQAYQADNTATFSLYELAGPNAVFAGWRGDPSVSGCGTASPCTISIQADAAISAKFNIAGAATLTMNVTGPGSVTAPAGGFGGAVVCRNNSCDAAYAPGASVTLAASADPGSIFVGFTGACTGLVCTLTMNGNTTVNAVFATAIT